MRAGVVLLKIGKLSGNPVQNKHLLSLKAGRSFEDCASRGEIVTYRVNGLLPVVVWDADAGPRNMRWLYGNAAGALALRSARRTPPSG
jgi:hypothetical protein